MLERTIQEYQKALGTEYGITLHPTLEKARAIIGAADNARRQYGEDKGSWEGSDDTAVLQCYERGLNTVTLLAHSMLERWELVKELLDGVYTPVDPLMFPGDSGEGGGV